MDINKKRVKLLDCTLRDGGSVNTWNFGQGGLRYAKFDNEAAKCAISRTERNAANSENT